MVGKVGFNIERAIRRTCRVRVRGGLSSEGSQPTNSMTYYTRSEQESQPARGGGTPVRGHATGNGNLMSHGLPCAVMLP